MLADDSHSPFLHFYTPPPFSDSDMLILLPNQTLRELREPVGCHLPQSAKGKMGTIS